MKANNQNLKIHIFDVGHGDSIIIEFPNQKTFGIIDCCYCEKTNCKEDSNLHNNNKEPKALTFLRKKISIDKNFEIEFVCLTHPHYDHYKGYSVLLNWLKINNIPIKQFWDFGFSYRKANALNKLAKYTSSNEVKEKANELNNFYLLRDEMEQKYQTEYKMITGPQKLFWSNYNVEIEVIAPCDSHMEKYANFLACKSESEKREFIKKNKFKWAADDNIASSAFLINFGNLKLLLGGDVINEGWYRIINNKNLLINCDIIKVSHHGSINGSFPFLNIEEIDKEEGNEDIPLWVYLYSKKKNIQALISGGYRKHLPHKKTMDSLEKMNIPWYCTGYVDESKQNYYIPSTINGSYKFYFENMKLPEVKDNYRSGHGDITVNCFENGKIYIETEYVSV